MLIFAINKKILISRILCKHERTPRGSLLVQHKRTAEKGEVQYIHVTVSLMWSQSIDSTINGHIWIKG